MRSAASVECNRQACRERYRRERYRRHLAAANERAEQLRLSHEGCDIALRAQAYNVERAKQECAEWRQRHAEAEAQAAACKDVLDDARLYFVTLRDSGAIGSQPVSAIIPRLDAALAPDAGRAMVERLRAAEAVVTATQAFRESNEGVRCALLEHGPGSVEWQHALDAQMANVEGVWASLAAYNRALAPGKDGGGK